MLAGLVLGFGLGVVLGLIWAYEAPLPASQQYDIDQKRLAEQFKRLTTHSSDEDVMHHAAKLCRGVGYPLRLEGIGFACVDVHSVRWVYDGKQVVDISVLERDEPVGTPP